MLKRGGCSARQGRLGNPSPNPHVGAVVVRSGQILGEGFHERPVMAAIMDCGSPPTIERSLVAMLAELQWQLAQLA